MFKGDLERVERLLSSGANPNTRDHAGWTPLVIKYFIQLMRLSPNMKFQKLEIKRFIQNLQMITNAIGKDDYLKKYVIIFLLLNLL